jgi:hypothetical protein
VAAAPAPRPGPFDFGSGGAVTGPEADFGFTEQTDGGLKGIGVRTRIARAAGWLNISAGSMVLLILYSLSLLIAAFALGGGYNAWQGWAAVGGLSCVLLALLIVPIIVFIGGRMVSRSRRWGVGLTAAIVSLVIGGFCLLFLLGWTVWTVMLWMGVGFATAQGAGSTAGGYAVVIACATDGFVGVVAFCGVAGGVAALRALINGEVKKTFS